jgi:antitoxin component of MazEF toxin-antitoxin module
MHKKLQQVGNSKALILTKDMLAHLGVSDDSVDIKFTDGEIVLRKSISFEVAKDKTFARYPNAYKKLAN